jgi:hypothetical protein
MTSERLYSAGVIIVSVLFALGLPLVLLSPWQRPVRSLSVHSHTSRLVRGLARLRQPERAGLGQSLRHLLAHLGFAAHLSLH